MATLIKTWSFPSDSDGWTLTNCGWNSGQFIRTESAGRRTKKDSTATITTTYGALGIPSGASITNIQVSIDARCAAYTATTGADWLFNIDGSAYISTITYTGTTSWATTNGSTLNVSKTDTDSITLLYDGYTENQNNSSALTQIDFDNIVLTITYTEATYDFSGSVSLDAATGTAMDNSKSTSGSPQLESATNLILASAKSSSEGITLSITSDITVTYSKFEEEPTYDFTGAVNLSAVAGVSTNSQKDSSSEIVLTTSTNSVINTEKHVNFNVNLSSESNLILNSTKSVSVNATWENASNIAATYSIEGPSYDFTGNVVLSAETGILASAAKQTLKTITLSVDDNIIASGSKSSGRELIIASDTNIAAVGVKYIESDTELIQIVNFTTKLRGSYNATGNLNVPNPATSILNNEYDKVGYSAFVHNSTYKLKEV